MLRNFKKSLNIVFLQAVPRSPWWLLL
jgi:hypothetical protein